MASFYDEASSSNGHHRSYEQIVDTVPDSEEDDDVALVTVVKEKLDAPMVPLEENGTKPQVQQKRRAGGGARSTARSSYQPPSLLPSSSMATASGELKSGRVDRSMAHCWSCMTLCPLSHQQAYETTDLRRHHVATHVHMFRTQFAQLGMLGQCAELGNDQSMMSRLWHTCFPQCAGVDLDEIPKIAPYGGATGKNRVKKLQRPTDIEEARKVLTEEGVETAATSNLLQCNQCGEVVDNEDAQTHYNACQKKKKSEPKPMES